MPFSVEASSGDVVVEASAATAADAFVELARAFSAVVTGGGKVKPATEAPLDLRGRDPSALVVAFLNDLVFRFDADAFLASGGVFEYSDDPDRPRLKGSLAGETYDPDRHGRGVEVKAATYHGLQFDRGGGRVRIRALLDL